MRGVSVLPYASHDMKPWSIPPEIHRDSTILPGASCSSCTIKWQADRQKRIGYWVISERKKVIGNGREEGRDACVCLYIHVRVRISECVSVLLLEHAWMDVYIYVHMSAHVHVRTYHGHIMSPHEHGIPRAHTRPTADYHFTSDLRGVQAVSRWWLRWPWEDDGEEGVWKAWKGKWRKLNGIRGSYEIG
jgi:hypothetical protein